MKEKRSLIKPILARLHREFNVSSAEMDRLDSWHESVIACAMIANDAAACQRALQSVRAFCEQNFPDVEVYDHRIEMV